MKQKIFTGSGVAIITPFKKDKVDFDKLKELIEFQIKNNTQAIIICGTTGESSTMSDEERKQTIKFAVDTVYKRIPVIAGTGGNNTQYAIELSKYAESVGVDGILLVTPYYNKTTQRGLIEHYKAIANSVTVPVILYNVPSRTGMSISVDTYVELSKIPNIVATKEASGDLSHIAKIAKKCGDDLYIYSGNDDQILPILSLGGIGVISVLANIKPYETNKMCEEYFKGNATQATNLQLKYLDLINNLFIETNPIPIKQALNELGYNVGECRLPLYKMSDTNIQKLKQSLDC